MAAQADERVMASERIAPGALPRVLNSVDRSIIFLAIVLFIVQASVIQPAGPTAYTYWILGFLLFLIPGCLSMVLLFADIFLVKRAFPQLFDQVRVSPPWVLWLSGGVGVAASIVGALVTFKTPWNTDLFSNSSWRWWLGIMVVVSAAAAIAIYAISEFTHRREAPTPTATPAA